MKRCPFCGAVPRFGPASAVGVVVRCRQCGARGPVFELTNANPRRLTMEEIDAELKTLAIEAWNKRDG